MSIVYFKIILLTKASYRKLLPFLDLILQSTSQSSPIIQSLRFVITSDVTIFFVQ